MNKPILLLLLATACGTPGTSTGDDGDDTAPDASTQPQPPDASTPLAPAPGQPGNLVVTESAPGTFDVSWSAAQNATGYLIAHAEGTQPPANCAGGAQTASLATQLSGLTTDRTYAIRVCAKNSNPTPDVSAGITATQYMQSAVEPNPTNLAVPGLDADWTKLTWNGSSPSYRVSFEVGTAPPPQCTATSYGTDRQSIVFAGLQPTTMYVARVCPSNGDSHPVFSDGTVVSFTTPARVEPRVNGLACATQSTDAPDLRWTGIGPLISYYYTFANVNTATSAPACGNTNAQSVSGLSSENAGVYRLRTSFLQVDQRYWFRICHRSNSGPFDQGQVIDLQMPRIVGSQILPSSCGSAPTFVRPAIAINTPSVSGNQVTVSGTCTLSGSAIKIAGDLIGIEATCSGGQWSATTTVLGSGSSQRAAVATPWNSTVFQGTSASSAIP